MFGRRVVVAAFPRSLTCSSRKYSKFLEELLMSSKLLVSVPWIDRISWLLILWILNNYNLFGVLRIDYDFHDCYILVLTMQIIE